VTAPVRGQRRRGVPSLVLPGDPDGCGWIAGAPGVFVPSGLGWGDRAPGLQRARYVGRPTRWGNPAKVVDDGGLGVRYAVMVDGPGFCEGLCADRAAANTRAAWVYESSSRKWVKDEPIELARADTLFDLPESRPAYEDLHTGWRNEFPIELPTWTELA
jgi:hypothetical protein